jgi:hypothetical protein
MGHQPRRSLLVLWTCVGYACGSLPQATPPALPGTGAAVEARERVYGAYALRKEDEFLRSTWRREDGSYSWGQLEVLAEPHPETRELGSDAALRDTVLGLLAGAGLGIVVGTAAHEIGSAPGQDFPAATETALYIAGASSFGLALLLSFVLPNPKDRFAGAYNAALRRDLELPDRRPSP